MIKIVLVLLYIWKGQITLVQEPYKTIDECVAKGAVKMHDLAIDPNFDGLMYGDCLKLPVIEANSNKKSS